MHIPLVGKSFPTEPSGLFQIGNIVGYLFIAYGVIDEVAREVLVIGCHIHEAVAREIEEYHFLFAGFQFLHLAYGGGDGVA